MDLSVNKYFYTISPKPTLTYSHQVRKVQDYAYRNMRVKKREKKTTGKTWVMYEVYI